MAVKKACLLFVILLLWFVGSFARIAFYGDTRSNPEIHKQIVAAIAKHSPQIVFHTGDLNSKGTQQSEYDSFLQIILPLSSKSEFWPVRGNHEKSLELFTDNFPALNGKSYNTLVSDCIRYIILDSVIDLKPGSDQYKWLGTALADSLPKIVLLHHPVFSSGEHGDELGLQMYLPQLLSKYSVKAVFSAHDHNYERSLYKDITYIVTGGGGAPFRNEKHDNPYSIVFNKSNHYLIADRVKSNLEFRVYALDGSILDSFVLKGF